MSDVTFKLGDLVTLRTSAIKFFRDKAWEMNICKDVIVDEASAQVYLFYMILGNGQEERCVVDRHREDVGEGPGCTILVFWGGLQWRTIVAYKDLEAASKAPDIDNSAKKSDDGS